MYYIFDTNRSYEDEPRVVVIHSSLPRGLTERLLCFTHPAVEDVANILAMSGDLELREEAASHPCFFEIEEWIDPNVFLGSKYSFRDLNPANKRNWYLLNRKEMKQLVGLWLDKKFGELKAGDDREKYFRNRVKAVMCIMEEVWPKSATSSGVATASTRARSTGAKRASASRKTRRKTRKS